MKFPLLAFASLVLLSLNAGATSYISPPETLYLQRIGSTLASDFEGEYTSSDGLSWTNGAGRYFAADGTSASPFSVWFRLRDSGPSGTVRGNAAFGGAFASYVVAPSGGAVIGFISGPELEIPEGSGGGGTIADLSDVEALLEGWDDAVNWMPALILGLGWGLVIIVGLEKLF